MAIWNIEKPNGDYVGFSNSGETSEEAIVRFITEWKCYAGADLRAVRMRAIYMNGGYCKIRDDDHKAAHDAGAAYYDRVEARQ